MMISFGLGDDHQIGDQNLAAITINQNHLNSTPTSNPTAVSADPSC